MNQNLRTMSLGLALVCATSGVLASDRVSIQQEGAGSAITIAQSDNTGENHAIIQQSMGYDYGGGGGQSATIRQSFVDGAVAGIFQSGSLNDFTINQHDGSNLEATITGNGDGNLAFIDQSGYGNRAMVESYGSNNRANINQIGYGAGGMNTAEIRQSGNDNVANITQIGSNHHASIMQNSAGSPNNITLLQKN